MKRNQMSNIKMSLCILAILVASLTVGAAAQSNSTPQGESLGDYARTVKKEKKPEATKHFDNDNLPKSDKLSVVGKAPDESPAPDAQTAENKPAAQTPAEDKQKANDEWKQKIASEQDAVNLLSRELDVLQREYKLRAAAMYGDAGNRLRNEGSWDKEDAQYKEQIAQKQKDLDQEKQKLADLQEQARKAGAPVSVRE